MAEKTDGGQMLACVSGRGWYQEWEQKPRLLLPGDVVNISAGVRHWHGATRDSRFQHLAIEVLGLMTGGWLTFMPPISASLPQTGDYGPEEQAVLDASRQFWDAMENADEPGMRTVANPNCTFVHIGMTCKLDEEIQAYTRGMFQPTEIVFHGQSVERYDDTAIVLTDCDYSLRLGGMNTTHHFAVTEVYVQREGRWRLIQFSFTALTS